MNFQALDSGVFVPTKKKESVQPPVLNAYEVEQKRRMEAGFPKVIKVTIGKTSCRLYIEGDDVYAETEDCPIRVELVSHFLCDREQYQADWRRIEYEILTSFPIPAPHRGQSGARFADNTHSGALSGE